MAKKKPVRKKIARKPMPRKSGPKVVRHEGEKKTKASRHTPGSLTRIEEAQMFTDRAVESLTTEIAELRKALERLAGRVVELERQVADAMESGPEGEEVD